MLVVYSIMNICFFIISFKIYNSKFNPISVYCIVWEIVLLLFNSGLIYYYPLSMKTWFVIILFQFVFSLGCFIGKSVCIKSNNNYLNYDDDKLQKELFKWIIITTFVSGFAILINFYHLISYYGLNILDKINNIYFNRVNNIDTTQTIPYLGSFIFIDLSLIGIYLKKYKFSYFLIFPLILVILNALCSGGRSTIVFNLLFFVFSYFLTDKSNNTINSKRMIKMNSFMKKLFLITIVVVFFGVIRLFTILRASSINLPYASDLFVKLFGYNNSIYKVIVYISAPVGVLNMYLKESTFRFGENTFLTIYSILGKLKIIESVSQYQDWYSIPLNCNVGTWIREIIQDFTMGGALVCAFVFSIIVSYFFKEAKAYQKIDKILISSMNLMFIAFSFFDWRLRSSAMWIAIIFGYFISKNISRKSIYNINNIERKNE